MKAQDFGLSCCGFLIFGDRGLVHQSGQGTREPAVMVEMLYTRAGLRQSVHLRFVGLTMCKSYLNTKKQNLKYNM